LEGILEHSDFSNWKQEERDVVLVHEESSEKHHWYDQNWGQNYGNLLVLDASTQNVTESSECIVTENGAHDENREFVPLIRVEAKGKVNYNSLENWHKQAHG
jgi:hypothetical protein